MPRLRKVTVARKVTLLPLDSVNRVKQGVTLHTRMLFPDKEIADFPARIICRS